MRQAVMPGTRMVFNDATGNFGSPAVALTAVPAVTDVVSNPPTLDELRRNNQVLVAGIVGYAIGYIMASWSKKK